MSRLDQIHTKINHSATALPDFASILIVEDQRFDRMRLKRLIDGLEFKTHIAEADCLETMGTMLQRDTFDLIFMDYNLPDGNGLLGLDAVRLDPKNRNAATIMVTGDDQTEIAIEALKRGCSDYITKDDLSPESFRRASINALQKSHLYIGIETQDNKRAQIEAVLQKFSSECAGEIKPVVSRMMRQLRDMRDAPSLSAEQAADRHARIEQSCMRLWEFLNDLEDYSGADLSKTDMPVREALASKQQDTGAAKTTPRRVTASPRDPFPADPTPPAKGGATETKKPSRGLFGRRPE